jgi:hypothetical protein
MPSSREKNEHKKNSGREKNTANPIKHADTHAHEHFPLTEHFVFLLLLLDHHEKSN